MHLKLFLGSCESVNATLINDVDRINADTVETVPHEPVIHNGVMIEMCGTRLEADGKIVAEGFKQISSYLALHHQARVRSNVGRRLPSPEFATA